MCYSVFKSKQWTEKQNPRWSGGVGKYTCNSCGKEFTPKSLRSKNNKYCSLQCSGKGTVSTRVGDKHWNWKGGIGTRHLKRTSPPKPDKCQVCGNLGSDTKKGLHLDHDHKTGKFRGWLCNGCNTSLGHCRDNPEILRKLARYLEDNENPL